MKHKILLSISFALCCLSSQAESTPVTNLKITGPVTVQKPFMLDSVNAAQTPFCDAKVMYGDVYTAKFSFKCDSWVNAEIKIDGAKEKTVLVTDKEVSGKQGYQPGQYLVEIKYVKDTADFKVSIDADKPLTCFVPAEGQKRPFNLMDNMLMSRYNSLSLSASGRYGMVVSSHFNTDGSTEYKSRIFDTQTGKIIRFIDDDDAQWMPKTERYLITRKNADKKELYSVDPVTLSETLLNNNLPKGNFTMTPTEDALIMTQKNEGPKHEDGVYEVINMEDRQPGYRDREKLIKYDLKTSMIHPLTFGNDQVWPVDISLDGKEMFFATFEHVFSPKRPTERFSLYKMDLTSLKTDTVYYRAGFIDAVTIVPGTHKALVTGDAEAFNGIGNILPEGKIPNIYEHQLFLLDLDTKKATALTKNFVPSIEDVVTATKDYAFFTAENADSVSLYRLNLKTLKIDFIKQPIEDIGHLAISTNGSTLLYYGSGACTPYKLYAMNTKSLKPVLLDNLNKQELADVEIGTCQPWRFKSKNGYELTGHVYLPAHFDSTKKYPMLVHYYGGCSPTSRRFGGGFHYPAHYWNALGYIVFIVNPSGAAGFGQEWGSRHVNTAGEGPAQDIIEATKWYCDNNSFVDSKALGCLSASYGGFMTQWILTKTDMFAAGVSHAGISDHTSYWGNGYWGYSYSEVSMANSFPWNRKDLYVDCSPLYNVEKIHTPLLFTHGTADTNVPTMESIQMFTAMKLLQKPTALVLVEGENHGIMDYTKRQKWINSICAWFQKYLKHDDSWWNAMYSPKDL